MSLRAIKKTFPFGAHQCTIETGEIARQAHGAVMVSLDDTVVLCTVVGAKNAKPGQDFFPLTVDYIEKTYAAGKIPGGFFKREGRPSEKEILTAMRFSQETLKLDIEPSSAVALAPLLRREPALVGRRVGVVLTGGNVDMDSFWQSVIQT